MSILNIQGLSAGYGSKEILNDLSLTACSGECVGILGRNGCGKTTLIKALCGMLPYRGSALLDGEELGSLRGKRLAKQLGYVPQKSGLAISLSVLDTVLMGFNPELGLLEEPDRHMREEAMESLARVGLADRAHEDYQTLSEGQKQMVILTRATVMPHKLLLLDEPENALDFSGRYRMADYLKTLSRDCAILVTLHDPQLALSFCDRLVLLSEGRAACSLEPAKASEAEIEEKLSRIYGAVSAHRLADRNGQQRTLIMDETL